MKHHRYIGIMLNPQVKRLKDEQLRSFFCFFLFRISVITEPRDDPIGRPRFFL